MGNGNDFPSHSADTAIPIAVNFEFFQSLAIEYEPIEEVSNIDCSMSECLSNSVSQMMAYAGRFD
jgi:hypothetical protein